MNHPWQHPDVIQHTQHLLNSFQYWTGRSLLQLDSQNPVEQAHQVFNADFVLLSHGTQSDPIFNYGNRQALHLWEFDWETFTQMPSRLSAEPIAQQDRAKLLAQAKSQGYISNYQGIRISRTGQRFWIEQVILWDVLNETKENCGQAATFAHWRLIE